MLEASSTGHAPPRNKTINTEVNLLAEWQRERGRVNELITRQMVALALFALVAFSSVPFLVRAQAAANERLTKAKYAVQGTSTLLADLESKQKAAKPRIDESEMHETVRHEATQFLGHAVKVINAAPAGMAFDTVGADVIGGELAIRCKADAESNSVVQYFIDHAGRGENVNSTLLATAQKNGKLSRDGVGFEYVKRIGVTP